MATGVELIATERQRQIEKEGFIPELDDRMDECQLAWLACYYAMPHPIRDKCHCGSQRFYTPDSNYDQTDLDERMAKRGSKTRLQRLIASGALIAAEIDRELRTVDQDATALIQTDLDAG